MRNTLPILARQPTDHVRAGSPSLIATPPQPIPTIRFVAATPSEANTTVNRNEVAPWANGPSPSPLAPKDANLPRKRLVPKKSKLGMLGTGIGAPKERTQDFSDVVRRVGGSTSTSRNGGYEIYVDPTEDPDLGELLMVKKKKSRAGLDGLRWGALGEVTNVPTTTKQKDKENKKVKDGLLKVKVDEKEKWWSIGRGRKDSKEKEKEKDRAKSPEPTAKPLKPIDSRARFNSLDSGILLDSPIQTHCPSSGSNSPTFATDNLPKRSATPTFDPAAPATGGLLLPPGAVGNGKNSVAIRAMRSVRSLARIGSWAQLKNMGNPEEGDAPVKSKLKENKDKDKDKGEPKKKKKKKEKEKEKEKEKAQTIRYSGSSFEAGALSASPEGMTSKTLGRKKASILGIGLGLPTTMRLPSVRSGSTASSVVATAQPANNRLSVDSATILGGFQMRDRSGSVMSTASSLRPMSTSSGVSGSSGGSSAAASVRWDEAGMDTVRERRKKEKLIRKEAKEARKEEKKKSKRKSKSEKDGGSRKTSESRRRTPLAAVFPLAEKDRAQHEAPVLTLEEATADGHSPIDEESNGSLLETPVKRARARPRPLSEQLLGRSRPRPLYEDDEDIGVISILDAATNDLAQLINHLDLEATPATPDRTPFKSSPFSAEKHKNDGSPVKNRLTADSPLKNGLRASLASLNSLRPYGHLRGKASTVSRVDQILGQNIAPWTTLSASISPAKSSGTVRASVGQENIPVLRLPTDHNMSPAPPTDSSPVFKPLRPAKAKYSIAALRTAAASPVTTPLAVNDNAANRSPSALTFGSAHSKSDSHGSLSASPVFKKAHSHSRKHSSLVPAEYLKNQGSIGKSSGSPSLPIAPDARRNLGLAGTMGGSVGSNANVELDASDPDSDIPDELQVILSGQSDGGSVHDVDDTLSFRPDLVEAPLPSPGLPPEMPLPTPQLSPSSSTDKMPVFRAQLIDEDDNHADIDEGGMSSEDDTKKSFDFTGELQKLNESGGSDRRSFVEQLENAFRTPAKIDLRYDFGVQLNDGLLSGDVPPVPKIPSLYAELAMAADSTYSDCASYSGQDFPLDANLEPSLLPGTDSLASSEHTEDELMDDEPRQILKNVSSMGSRPSDGQLNRDFKFGGRPSPPRVVEEEPKDMPMELTLSDIIPPLSHARALSTGSAIEDDSVLKSIFAKASEIPSPAPRMRLDSDSSSKRRARGVARTSLIPGHYRNSSDLSFAGFDSFAEVRRGFEFANRPDFYPPPGATSHGHHGRHESVFSIASVSSYGHVINPGSSDPFEYGPSGLPSLRERPSSDDFSFSMSMSVDDTFSFIHRQAPRKRVDSDASSFYFRAGRSSVHSQVHPYNRSHRRHESTASVSSMAPPVSMYNRSFGHHRRNESNTSTSSVAQSYAMYGANGGRAAWARHRPDFSVDSMASDYSAVQVGRPGLGDKMLDSAPDYGMPLTAISASPPESLAGSVRNDHYGNRTSYDSIMDGEEPKFTYTLPDDSLFDKTGHRTSVSSDCVFGNDDSFYPRRNAAGRYRPISVLSEMSVHSPAREDDTMISMLGGGHVRRRSLVSQIEGSPCVRQEKKKHTVFDAPEPAFQIKGDVFNSYDSPNMSRIIPKPSIASTANSFKFGDERMIRAKHGLLERQSLEASALIADGEDISLSMSFRPQPVFSRPGPATRSRSSTCTSSSGGDTPPLSASDGYSSFSEGSQSSIDLSHINYMLSNTTYPMSNAARARIRPRARGQGHRRRISQARASRASIYETIEEEMSVAGSPMTVSMAPGSATKTIGPAAMSSVYVVDPETASVDSMSLWDDERGITALRKYYALRDEAQDTVQESKRVWMDTPFSVFAVQSFDPPRHPNGMQALLEHSIQNYGPLPSDLRPRCMRSRTHSRPSPYPRQIKTSFSSSPAAEQARATAFVFTDNRNASAETTAAPPQSKVLQQVSINPNIMSPPPEMADKDMGVLKMKPEQVFGLPPRPRVASTARRTALGWAKRSTGRENKENANSSQSMNMSQGITMTPAESLRLNRPRPRGRPTPASARPIRI
ncbi:hypothetical protein SERLADRAFT_443108 [Serpula lacrymans var. lacrymans S7.9]|uniref:Uncharacterized protein n=1 Tax=Serpula lacrymans var. lacrymans (strain S7.9) TaxID=578457 RepID=F8PBK1_SERL9|nr:uncharacterized protein SERLADRAFT_443108 [Serpula lacrymans var. lacrymans S7.9]EGO19639.1 hypothetical protein SERLADRAFT_443108 [Serpula lacrymans var. lacrymans S7.9]